MLPEKPSYPYDFPLNIKIVSVDECPLHHHQDVELVFVLNGEIKLKNGCCNYILTEGKIFVNNGREVHGLYKTDKDNVVAIIQISNLYFTKYFPALTRSSYRTYATKETDDRFNQLRKLTLDILSVYLKKSIDYKQKCIDKTIELIDFFNKNFNFFSFEKKLVVSPNYDDLVLIERMSRIIPYIYEHHAEKISLKELAEMEHLSTFYISHMIKTCTGLSLREFLCFARVELSEILLLSETAKINTVACEVGFSTTAYYKKFFQLWFGCTPQEHREKHLPLVKSPLRQERMLEIDTGRSIFFVRQGLTATETQASSHLQVQRQKLELNVDPNEPAIVYLEPEFEIEIAPKDYEKLEDELFIILNRFNCKSIELKCQNPGAQMQSELECTLKNRGFSVSIKDVCALKTTPAYCLDSTINLVRIFHKNLLTASPIHAKLMDSGSEEVLLKGDSGMLTSSGIYKPAYYGHLFLSKMKGQLIARGKHYAVLKVDSEDPCFIIAVFNYDERAEQLCSRKATLHEVEDIIRNFNNEIDINVNILGLNGKFSIKKYSFTRSNSIFDYMAKLGFPHIYNPQLDFGLNDYTSPNTDVFTEIASENLSLNFSVKGLGLQIAVIEPISSSVSTCS